MPRDQEKTKEQLIREVRSLRTQRTNLRKKLLLEQGQHSESSGAIHFAKAFAEVSSDIIYIFDITRKKGTYCNPQISTHLSYTPEEIRAMGADLIPKLIHPSDALRVYENLKSWENAKDDTILEFEYRARAKDGQWHWFLARERVLHRDSKGKVSYVVGTARDITEIKRHNQILSHRENQLGAVFDAANTGIALFDKSLRLIQANPHFADMLGYTQKELVGMNLKSITHPDDLELSIKHINTALAGSQNLFLKENRYLRKDGSVFWGSVAASFLPNEDGLPESILAVVVDITDSKRAEVEKNRLQDRLRQTQKMEAIGTLSGGIAHDFNNLLTAILANTDLALIDLDDSDELKENLQEIKIAASRAKDLVAQILAFTRQIEDERRPIWLQPLIHESIKLLRGSLPSTIDIHLHLDEECDPVFADPTRIHQVLMNLCTNAFHAMRKYANAPQKHKRDCILDVSLQRATLSSDEISMYPNMQPGPHVLLIIRDTGTGMDKKTIARIFDPYFTTKAKGEGTGLGLTTVHNIIESHGGTIHVSSAPAKGTTFRILLPAYQLDNNRRKQPSSKKSRISPPPPTPRKEKILLVDDEGMIVRVCTKTLTRFGYQVTACSNGQDALDAFESHPDDFDLIITDLTMPRMTGIELAEKIFLIRPRMPIILCTGFTEQSTIDKALKMGIRKCSFKPLIASELLSTIEYILHGKAKPSLRSLKTPPPRSSKP